MSKTVVLDNEWFTIWYYTDTKIVHSQIHQFIYGERFKECVDTIAKLMEKHRAKKMAFR
jgi:hypothetical protein